MQIQPLWLSSLALFLHFSKIFPMSFMIFPSNSHLLLPEPQDPSLEPHAPGLPHPAPHSRAAGAQAAGGRVVGERARGEARSDFTPALSFLHPSLRSLRSTCHEPRLIARAKWDTTCALASFSPLQKTGGNEEVFTDFMCLF